MAELRCPNCGKSNPDSLDVCQFCQTPLKPESVLRIGDKPTKKNTGELEPILPDWLKDMRQQAKDAATEDAAHAAAQPRPQKNEPPDLLAGLASQSAGAEEEDIPDWLASLNPRVESKPETPSTPQAGPEPVSETPPQEETPAWARDARDQSPERDELAEWLTQASGRAEEILEPEGEQDELGWRSGFDSPSDSVPKSPPKEEEDLSWLHNLEAASKKTGELQDSKSDKDWKTDFEPLAQPSQPSASQDDLSWLDRLSGLEETSPSTSEPTAAPKEDLSWLEQFSGRAEPPQTPPATPTPSEDLSWLNQFSAAQESLPMDAAPNQPGSPQPFAAGEDLDWLNKLGGAPEAAQPGETPSPVGDQPATEDLSWLNNLGRPAQASESAAEPPASQEDLSWLNDLGKAAEPPFAPGDLGEEKQLPRQTAPLNKQAREETEPDWLKRAIEAPSMPAPGDLSMDWFSGASQAGREKTPPPAPQSSPFEADIFSAPSEPAPLSNREVDSLLSMDMPDWLSRPEPGTAEPGSQEAGTVHPESAESLAPVDLPSWVQAMRPVEAVISESAPRVSDQPAETEGPLAGLQGVIPIAPIGSSRKPKAVSLTLQASEEQQASALLLEQILGSETSPRPLAVPSMVASQQWLRWALTGLFLVVLSLVILLRSQIMPISADLPAGASGLTNVVLSIPSSAKVLVVIDYEPSLAGEMEATSGPLLYQMVFLSQPTLSFLSTSPNGPALVNRLVMNAGLNQPTTQYRNLGYLPGGSAGILGFINSPAQIIATADVQGFSEYATVIVLTDHAESGRMWVEQLQTLRASQAAPAVGNQPLLMIASAQAGPLLQPYVSSGQISGMISGVAEAARYQVKNSLPSGTARSYWDALGIGLMLAVLVIIIGSLWSLVSGLRARTANAEQR